MGIRQEYSLYLRITLVPCTNTVCLEGPVCIFFKEARMIAWFVFGVL